MRMMRAVTAVLLFAGFVSTGAEAAEKLPFELATASYQTVPREEVFDATIEAINQATVSAQTSGRVTEINFDVDDYVKKGEVLLRLRDKQQRAALQSAEARYKEARSDYNRTRDLYKRKLVAKAALDKAEAALKSSRAARDQAKEQLDYTVVRAPYSGIVVKRDIEVGETANPGQPLMTGLSLEALRATTHLPQEHINKIRQMDKARIILPDGKSVDGTKLTISPYADPQAHTFKVRVDLPPGQHGVYPGELAKVAFLIGEEKRLLVPTAAIVHRSEVTAVYIVEKDGRVVFRQVRIGRTLGDGMTEVLAGMSDGEKVALDPVSAGVYLMKQRAGDGS